MDADGSQNVARTAANISSREGVRSNVASSQSCCIRWLIRQFRPVFVPSGCLLTATARRRKLSVSKQVYWNAEGNSTALDDTRRRLIDSRISHLISTRPTRRNKTGRSAIAEGPRDAIFSEVRDVQSFQTAELRLHCHRRSPFDRKHYEL